MERDLKEQLQILEEMERENMTDNFNNISHIVGEYKNKFGHDEWIDQFCSEYLEERRERYQKI